MRLLALILLLLLGLLQYRLWYGHNGLHDFWRTRDQLAEAHRQNDQLTQRNELIREEIRELKDGAEGIEERARNELGFIRDGETFYRVLDANPKDASLKDGNDAP